MAKPKSRRPAKKAAHQKPDVASAAAPAPEHAEVAVTPAKGRPMLHWVGKRPLSSVKFFPAQHVETFEPTGGALRAEAWADWPGAYPNGGLLFHGDNKEVLGHLLASGFRGKVNLVYIDPPFDSGADYVRRVSLRGPRGKAKIEGESYTLGEQIQYADIWANDNYLQFMFERLSLIKECLADGGSIFLHCDSSRGHLLRCVMDEVFGSSGFLNEIIWSYRRWPADVRAFQTMHDSILWYSVGRPGGHIFHKEFEPASASYLKRFGGKTQKLDEETGTRKITTEDETKGMPLRDVWDISIIAGFKAERTGYPTQKPEALLERIIRCCSNPGDLVLDCFIGSGTTAAVAQRLGRRWIGADINKGAIQTTAKRLQSSIQEQATETEARLETEGDGAPAPAQTSFTVWRVNDYDLAIQHNEAVNLACEKLGVERKRTDPFFDGTLGKSLVKIVPFGHGLTPLDLEEVKRELEARPDEDRPVTMVALGIELAAKAWVEDWNRLRKGREAVNRIAVIDLRADPKHGGFLRHEPAKAKVKISRSKDRVTVEIEDFVSPSIIERLREQAGILSPKIDDWRAMVDCVMVDPAYDGDVFKVSLTDVPERKSDLVAGTYVVHAPAGPTTVAVKIIDMLGEEVLITKEL
ncbi:MAG: DNA methyltransferase [Planctomycetota bacterium]